MVEKKKKTDVIITPSSDSQKKVIAFQDIVLSSAAITIGAALFFLTGWMYEVQWYGFYGVNITQLNLPSQMIIAHSIPAIFIVSTLLISIYFFVVLIKTLVSFVIENKSAEKRTITTAFFEETIKESVYVSYFLYSLMVFSLLSYWQWSGIEFDLDLSGLMVMLMFTCMIYFLIVTANIFIKHASFKDKNLFQLLFSQSVIDAKEKQLRDLAAALMLLLSAVFFSGHLGMGDAQQGYRRYSGGEIEKVYAVSQTPILGLENYSLPGDDDGHRYGPFGYVTENEHFIFLVEWKQFSPGRFVENLKLYQIDYMNENSINLLPFEEADIQPILPVIVTATPTQP